MTPAKRKTVTGLSDPRAKAQRAREHQAELETRGAEWLPHAVGMTLRRDPDSEWFLFRFHERGPRPPLGLVLGDVVNNLKGALDILVWQLVLVAGNRPRNSTAFPVATTESQWRKEAQRRLPGVAGQWAAVIDELQPYRAKEPLQHPLAILNRTNNRSKHQVVAPTLISELEWTPEFEVRVPGTTSRSVPDVAHELEVTWPTGEDLVDGMVIGRVRFDAPVTSVRVVANPGRVSMAFDVHPPVTDDWPDLPGYVDGVLERFTAAFE